MVNDWLATRRIAVIGLGYVGLPLAAAFGKKYPVVGFDINDARINELRNGIDRTGEVETSELSDVATLEYTSSIDQISDANVYIVTVPTPVDDNRQPDLTALRKASSIVGSVLSEGNVVIYESTVYPGCTEEQCVPILVESSSLMYNRDFFVGYSPERINPGDRERRLVDIVKIVSGSNPDIAEKLNQLYSSIVSAGTHLAPNIKTAEAAKVIENTQRDVNIALVNELSLIFEKMEIDTNTVLDAACTKWNFLNFRPGLVGGHCIGIDPYYLTYKAQSLGHNPEVILSGRRINDEMGRRAALRLVKALAKKGGGFENRKVLVLGLTFKENCPDLRNTRVVDIINELQDFGIDVSVWDPCCDRSDALDYYRLEVGEPDVRNFDAVILAVPHSEFLDLGSSALKAYGKIGALFFALKGAFPIEESDIRL